MDRCSYFFEDKALFGVYPSQETVNLLEQYGVVHFINLTCEGEKNIVKYCTTVNYINYPITDHSFPKNWKSFSKFILTIFSLIKTLKKEKIYIHCRGGHGRSGIVVACVLCYMFNLDPSVALKLSAAYHRNRKDLRYKWRVRSPCTNSQKGFVYRFFRPLIYYRGQKYLDDAYNQIPIIKVMFNILKEQKNTLDFETQYNYQDKVNDETIVYQILKLKFQQNDNERCILIGTGLRSLVYHSSDLYWGDDFSNKGKNKLGQILTNVRNMLYIQDI